MLPDLVRCYGACGRTIIFTETKRDANELLNVLSEARALHGDIPQAGVPLTGLVGCSHRVRLLLDIAYVQWRQTVLCSHDFGHLL